MFSTTEKNGKLNTLTSVSENNDLIIEIKNITSSVGVNIKCDSNNPLLTSTMRLINDDIKDKTISNLKEVTEIIDKKYVTLDIYESIKETLEDISEIL